MIKKIKSGDKVTEKDVTSTPTHSKPDVGSSHEEKLAELGRKMRR